MTESDDKFAFQGVQTVVVPAHDVPESCSFYEGILGLRRVYENRGRVAVDGGGTRILIHPSGSGTDYPNAPLADTESMPAIYWSVTNVDALVENVRNAGGVVAQEPSDTPWGERDACILDPDGYRIYVTQAKSNTWMDSEDDSGTP